jgi:hypothetical protein
MTVIETVLMAAWLFGCGLMTLWGAWMFAMALPRMSSRGRLWVATVQFGAMNVAGAVAMAEALKMIWRMKSLTFF